MSLNVSQISKNFGGITALDNCTFTLESGKITAIIGPNGSGKSTLFNVISRIVKEEQGKIMVDNHSINTKKDFQVARLGISRTFQEVHLFRNLTIAEHLEIALNNEDEKLLKSIFMKKKDYTSAINEILKLVKLDKPRNTLATDLSYGQRKLLDLAMVIAKPHTILLLDEPVAGINPELRQEIKEILKSLNQQKETVVLIEHDMNFVMDLADHIIVMDEGKVIAEGKPEEIQNNPEVLEAYLGK